MLGFVATASVFASFLNYASAIELVPIKSPETNTEKTGAIWDRRSDESNPFELKNQETFLWGAPTTPGSAYLANLTMFTPHDTEHIVSMERFSKNLEHVDCTDPDLTLDFTDKRSLEAAKKAWGWVNEEEIHHFVMVADHERCGPDRQPFLVTGVRYDEMKSIAHLTANEVAWEEVAHSYHLKIGHVPSSRYQQIDTTSIERRFGGTVALSTESSFNGDWFSENANGLETTVGCTDCGTSGKVNFEFEVDVGFFKIDAANMKISPEGVAATMELGVTTTGSLNSGWGWDKTLVSIPLEGISIGSWAKIGGFFDVDTGFKIGNWTGTVEATMGATLSLDDGAIIEIDLLDSANNQVSGWVPQFEPIPFHVSAKVECEAEAYLKPNLKLAAEAFKKGWEVELGLRMPYVEANIAAVTDSAGVCDTDQTAGIEGGLSIGVDLEVSAATADNTGNPFWTYTILEKEWPLLDVCIPFGDDGEPEPTSSSVPPSPTGSYPPSSMPNPSYPPSSYSVPNPTYTATSSYVPHPSYPPSSAPSSTLYSSYTVPTPTHTHTPPGNGTNGMFFV